jgi:hypothetical protein
MANATATQTNPTLPTRTSLGPLTTSFTPPAGCELPVCLYYGDWPGGGAGLECEQDPGGDPCNPNAGTMLMASMPCMPDGLPVAPGAFFSPAVVCPQGYPTAAVLSVEDFVAAASTLLPGETAAYCCSYVQLLLPY